RIGLALGPPQPLRPGIARHADFLRDLVVEGRDIIVGNRPVMGAVVLALDAEIIRQQAGEIGEVVQRCTAYAPAALGTHADRMLAFEDERSASRFDAAAPDIG